MTVNNANLGSLVKYIDTLKWQNHSLKLAFNKKKRTNMLLETANLEDKTGHLVVNICFDVEKADSKTIMHNKLDPSIFEKQKFFISIWKICFSTFRNYASWGKK